MLKGIIVAADGAEDTELVAMRDIFLRTKEIEIDLVTLGDKKEFVTSHGLRIGSDKTIDEVKEEDYDFICLPGGKVGVDNMKASNKLKDLVMEFANNDKYVAAICAAPSFLGELGLLKGKRYICFPGFETEGGIRMEAGVVDDGKIVTGRSMYYTIPFAEMMVKCMLGEKAVAAVFPGTRGV